jgi:N-acyl homoserine lactone hydrolase
MFHSRMTAAMALGLVALATTPAEAQTDTTPATPRLYVLDGGVLASDPTRYRLTAEDVGETALSVAAYLIVHPQGVLLWDAGAIADRERLLEGEGIEQRVLRRDGDERFVVLGPALLEQIEASGVSAEDVTYLALSHYHWDHTANANEFTGATWLVPTRERAAMFAADPPGGTRPVTYAALENSETVEITADTHDVFGDGSVVIMQEPGHTEGHSVLYVKLAETGGVLLSGDLYHYPAERTLERLPTFELSEEQTAASRQNVEEFLERSGAELWIQHDLVHHRTLRLAPEYYE